MVKVTTFCFVLIDVIYVCPSRFDQLPKNINDLFPRSNKSTPFNKDAAFDIKSIDINKFNEKANDFNLTDKYPNSTQNDTRKSGVRLDLKEYITYLGRERYKNANDVIAKNKILDIYLQLIYMARHTTKRIDEVTVFDRNDRSYRVGILCMKLEKIYKQMINIYQTMANPKGQYIKEWDTEKVDEYLIMHHRVVKLHVDFTYIFWVLVKLDDEFMTLNSIKKPTGRLNRTIKGQMQAKWGISIESQQIG